jgi:hypothetical protein
MQALWMVFAAVLAGAIVAAWHAWGEWAGFGAVLALVAIAVLLRRAGITGEATRHRR